MTNVVPVLFLYGDESKFELARNLDDRLQSQNVPLALLVICTKISSCGILKCKRYLRVSRKLQISRTVILEL